MVDRASPTPPSLALRLGEVMRESGVPGLRELFEDLVVTANRDAAVGVGKALSAITSPLEGFFLALDSEDPQIVSLAAVRIGELIEPGDQIMAAKWYLHALESDRSDAAYIAAYRLATIVDPPDAPVARELYRVVARGDHAELAPAASLALGEILKSSDPEAALAEFRTAMSSPHHTYASLAALEAGVLHEKRAEKAESITAYRAAYESRVQGVWPWGALWLSALLEPERPVEAEECLRAAAESGDDDVAPRALTRLGQLLLTYGRGLEGRAALERALASKHEAAVASAGVELALSHAEEGNIDEARAAWRRALAIGNPKLGELMLSRGLHYNQDDLEDLAFVAFSFARECPEPDIRGYSASSMGGIFSKRGEGTKAIAAYRDAIAEGYPPATARAAFNLGLLLEDEDPQEARAAYRTALACQEPEIAQLAKLRLELLDALTSDAT